MPQSELSDCGWQCVPSVRAQHCTQMRMIAIESQNKAPVESETLPVIDKTTFQVNTARLGVIQHMFAKQAHLVVQLGMCPQTNAVSQHRWWPLIYIQVLSA